MNEFDFNSLFTPPLLNNNYFSAQWPAPKRVKTLITTRLHGYSKAPYSSLNMATHVGDYQKAVEKNRHAIQCHIANPMIFLNQIHGTHIVSAQQANVSPTVDADGLWDSTGQYACAIMTADCLPILICNQAGTKVMALHAGWKGLVNGIVQQGIKTLEENPENLIVYFGPAISQDAFEVGKSVYTQFTEQSLEKYQLALAFKAISEKKYLANLYDIARRILTYHGVEQIYGGQFCTVIQNQYFYSYRKEHQTGRIASVIWLTN